MILQFNKIQHAQFFRYVTGNGKTTDITVNRKSDIGRLVHALAMPSNIPVNVDIDPDKITVEFHLCQIANPKVNDYYWFIPKWAQVKINDFVISEFNQSRRYFMMVASDIGIQQKVAAEIFLASHKVDTDKFCSVVKSDQRYRDRISQIIDSYVKSYGYQGFNK